MAQRALAARRSCVRYLVQEGVSFVGPGRSQQVTDRECDGPSVVAANAGPPRCGLETEALPRLRRSGVEVEFEQLPLTAGDHGQTGRRRQSDRHTSRRRACWLAAPRPGARGLVVRWPFLGIPAPAEHL